MSDHLSQADKDKIQFKLEHSTEGFESKNKISGSESKVCFKIVLPKATLKYMSEVCPLNNLTYIQLLNLNLPKGMLPLKENNDRIEGR